MTLPVVFTRRLRKVRRGIGISQNALSKISGVKQSHVCKIEGEVMGLTPKAAMRLIAGLFKAARHPERYAVCRWCGNSPNGQS